MDLIEDVKKILGEESRIEAWIDPKTGDIAAKLNGGGKNIFFLIALVLDSILDRMDIKLETAFAFIECYCRVLRLSNRESFIRRPGYAVNQAIIKKAMQRMKEKRDGKPED